MMKGFLVVCRWLKSIGNFIEVMLLKWIWQMCCLVYYENDQQDLIF